MTYRDGDSWAGQGSGADSGFGPGSAWEGAGASPGLFGHHPTVMSFFQPPTAHVDTASCSLATQSARDAVTALREAVPMDWQSPAARLFDARVEDLVAAAARCVALCEEAEQTAYEHERAVAGGLWNALGEGWAG